MRWSLPANTKVAPTADDVMALQHAYGFCAERLKEIGSYASPEEPGNRYVGGWANGNRQRRGAELEFDALQEAMRNLSKLISRYRPAVANTYGHMLYRRYNFEGEVILVPNAWPVDLIAANVAKVRIFGPDESKW